MRTPTCWPTRCWPGPATGPAAPRTPSGTWLRRHPAEGERGFVYHIFAAAELPGLVQVFEAHHPLWQFGPSDDGVRAPLAYWREVVPETGELRRDFTDPNRSTRFLGEMYQQLSAAPRKHYALLQTPHFVKEFILDHTLEPAIEELAWTAGA